MVVEQPIQSTNRYHQQQVGRVAIMSVGSSRGDSWRGVACLHVRDHGGRLDRQKARLMWLVEEWGVDKFRDSIAERMGEPLSKVPCQEPFFVSVFLSVSGALPCIRINLKFLVPSPHMQYS